MFAVHDEVTGVLQNGQVVEGTIVAVDKKEQHCTIRLPNSMIFVVENKHLTLKVSHEDRLASLRKQGLIPKYIISKSDGRPMDADAEYFVLRYDDKGSDPIHTAACRVALRAYAEAVKDHLPKLAADLIEKCKAYEKPA